MCIKVVGPLQIPKVLITHVPSQNVLKRMCIAFLFLNICCLHVDVVKQLADVQTKHQNGCWCQSDWTEYSRNCWSTFNAKQSVGFTEIGPKKRKYSVRQLCRLKCLFDVSGQRRMGRLVQDDRKSTVTQIITVTTKEEDELQQ